VYDAAGNMVKGPDAATPATQRRFVYDAWNRLVAYTDSGDNVIAEYRYDGLNRRIAKLLAGDDWDRTDYYYNEAWQVLEERLAEDVDEADKDDPATTMRCQYIWDIRYIDAPVVRFRDTNGDGTADDTLYYCNDANMNVTALVNASDGGVAERYEYDPYGNLTVLNPDWSADAGNASDYDNEILYAGYRHDPESALYQVRNRYYHCSLGRWMSRDPKVYVDGLSLYQYAVGRPFSGSDPYGLLTLGPNGEPQCEDFGPHGEGLPIDAGGLPTYTYPQPGPVDVGGIFDPDPEARIWETINMWTETVLNTWEGMHWSHPGARCEGAIVARGTKVACDGYVDELTFWGEEEFVGPWMLPKVEPDATYRMLSQETEREFYDFDFTCKCSYLHLPDYVRVRGFPDVPLDLAECEWRLESDDMWRPVVKITYKEERLHVYE